MKILQLAGPAAEDRQSTAAGALRFGLMTRVFYKFIPVFTFNF